MRHRVKVETLKFRGPIAHVKRREFLIRVQSRTNKDNNFDISGTTNFFGNLTSESNSECQKTSENMSFIIFPRVVKVANNFGQNPQLFWVIQGHFKG